MYTTGTDYTTGATTTNYTTQQYNYEYQYQMPTTTKTTTTTTQYTTTPVTTTFSTAVPDYTSSVTTHDYSVSNVEAYPSTIPGVAVPGVAIPGSVTTVSTPLTTVTTPLTTVSTTPVTTTTTYTTGVVPGVVSGVVPGFVSGPVKPQPVFNLLRQGAGISPHEQQGIVSTAMLVYQYGITPISNNTASRIKKTLGGDWIVIVYPQGKPVDFNMTCVQGNDYMYFTLDNMAYQVCRLR